MRSLVASHLDTILDRARPASAGGMWMSSIDLHTWGYPASDPAPGKRVYRFIDAPNGCTCYWDQPALAACDGLSGKPESVGESLATMEVTDSFGRTASRELWLRVVPDSAPEILTPTLPALSQGTNVAFTLQARGGNGQPRWSLMASLR